MDQTTIQWLVTQVGLAGVAAFSIYVLNKVWSDRSAEQSANKAQERQDKQDLLLAYKDNISTMKEVSSSLSRQSETLERLCAIVDRQQK